MSLAPNERDKLVATAAEQSSRPKLVRDGFTMPESEYRILGETKKACLKAGIAVRKSELLRIGVAMIQELDTDEIRLRLAQLLPLKTGRPKKSS